MDRYATRLAGHLRRMAADLEIGVAGEIGDLTVEQPSRAPGLRVSQPSGLPLLPAPGLSELRRYLSRYVLYPRRVRRQRADVVHVLDHSYAHLMRSRVRRPRVVTVHDLLPVITVARGGRQPRVRLRNWLLQRVLEGLRHADAWIVATEWLRNELAEWLGAGHDDRIHVIPFGVDDAFFERPNESRNDTRRRLELPANAFVVLHVGSVGPRKNIPTVIEATATLRGAGVEAWLLQVGGTLSAEQREDVEKRGIARHAISVGEAVETDLRAAYHAADVLLFPSHYEGFGFPVLEAMASGLPVVTSGAGGLAEVAGDAAIVVGGRETEPYVKALLRVAGNRHWRDQLRVRGLERAKRFRWDDTARRTAEVYRRLAGER